MRLRFVIRGMSCSSCAASIEKNLSQLEEVASASVSFASLRADVELIGNRNYATPEGLRLAFRRILNAIGSLGFQAEPLSTAQKLYVSGMSCAGCAYTLESEVMGLLGVIEASANFATSSVEFSFLDDIVSAEEIRKHIAAHGFRERDVFNSTDEEGGGFEAGTEVLGSADRALGALSREDEIAFYKHRFLGSLLFSFPLFFGMFLFMSEPLAPFEMRYAFGINVVSMILATPCVLFFGREYFLHAYANLQHFRFTMDTLVAFGVGGAYSFSVVALVLLWFNIKTACYFDTAAELITFMLLGRFLEALAKARTGDALVLLLKLTPATARLIRSTPDGTDEVVVVPSSSVRVGDIVQVQAGEHIPIDGRVAEGLSEVDESSVTGESLPRTVYDGSEVIGGTINVSSVLRVTATAVGGSTVVSKIIRIVEEAQRTKPAIQRFADRIAAVFVPCVIGISVSVFVVWAALGYLDAYPDIWRENKSPYIFAFENFLSTLVVACPCALGLATPTAIMVGTGIGAEMGILSKSGLVLETAPVLETFIFDKTGTLTRGKLEVTASIFFDQSGRLCESLTSDCEADLSLIALVEGMATHPIAAAVCRKVRGLLTSETRARTDQRIQEVTGHTVVGGKGVRADVGDVHVRVGTVAYVQEIVSEMPAGASAVLSALSDRGRTLVVAAVGGKVVAIFGLADSPKPEAREVISHLTRSGKKVMMVTGDNITAALQIARYVGISDDNVEASCLPSDKEAIVSREQQGGVKVAFVGDGTNDSPALAQSDVGIALGAGTDIAVECADAVLMHDNLRDIIAFIDLSSAVVRRVRFNFAWALIYNALMMPAAAGVFYPVAGVGLPPVVAGLAMIFSSLSVLASSLALRCAGIGVSKSGLFHHASEHTEVQMELRDFDGETGAMLKVVHSQQSAIRQVAGSSRSA